MFRWMKNKNNKGAALVTVIIAITVVAILGILIAYITYSNFTMKVVDKYAKNNFYSAESVLDEVVAGLEEDMSREYAAAYSKVMASYGMYPSVTEMSENFRVNYVLNLVEALSQKAETIKDPDDPDAEEVAVTEDPSKYSISKLKGYVNPADFPADSTYTVDFSKEDRGEHSQNALETLTDGLMLRNVMVTYTQGGYTNTITTDIKLAVPQVTFSRISEMPNIADFAYIAQKGIDIGGNVELTLDGYAYSGNDEEITDAPALNIQPGAVLTTTGKSELLIADGDIDLTGAAQFATDKSTALWTDNVNAKPSSSVAKASNVITLMGRTYVKDDITLNGAENNLTLANQYFGFQGTASGKKSSAIIINGQNTSMDFSKLNTLVLAGTAYVAGSKNASDGTVITNQDVMTGDSIAVKSNQLAYLVPADAPGVVSNPMSYSQYQSLVSNSNWQTRILTETVPSLKRSLSSFASEGTISVVPVYTPNEGGTVYLYLSFQNTSEAAQYFMNIMGAGTSASERLQQYIGNYINVFKTSADGYSRLATNGNYLVPAVFDEESGKWVEASDPQSSTISGDGGLYHSTVSSTGEVGQELDYYNSSYEALCCKLLTTCTEEEKELSVFENLIIEDNIVELVTAVNGNTDSPAVLTAADGTQAILVVGDYTVDPATFKGSGKGVILATGNVTVTDTSWNGVIICKGKLTVGANTKLSSDIDAVSTALRIPFMDEEGENAYAPLNCFVGGENYSFLTEQQDNGVDLTDVRNCVSYLNWKSE